MPDKLFSKTNGSRAVEIGESVMLSRSVPRDVIINGARYLEAGYLETNPAKFDIGIFPEPVNSIYKPHGGYYSPVIFSETLNQFILGVRASITPEVAVVDAGLTSTAKLTKKGTFPAIGGNAFTYSICEGNGLFVFGVESNVVTSPDLISFTQRALPFSGYVKTAIYGNGVFVIGAGYSIGTSSDGISWTNVTSNVYPSNLLSGVYSPVDAVNPQGVFLLGCDDGKIIRSVDNGTSFTEIANPLTMDVLKLRLLDGVIYAVSSDAIAISNDAGESWSLVSGGFSGYSLFSDITQARGYFIILRKGNLLATKDFITFFELVTGTSASLVFTTIAYDKQNTIIFTADNTSYAYAVDFFELAAGNVAKYVEGDAKQHVRIS